MTSDLRRQVAQLLVVRGSGHWSDGQRRYPRWELPNAELHRLLDAGVGGVILLGGSAAELRLRTDQLRRWADGPLLLCADVEEGVGQRFEGASWLVPPGRGPTAWPRSSAGSRPGRALRPLHRPPGPAAGTELGAGPGV